EFSRMMGRLDNGESGETVLPDHVAAHYSVAGTPRECLEGVQAYREAGVTELGGGFAADRAIASIERLGESGGGAGGCHPPVSRSRRVGANCREARCPLVPSPPAASPAVPASRGPNPSRSI